jgi:hypothetical protein
MYEQKFRISARNSDDYTGQEMSGKLFNATDKSLGDAYVASEIHTMHKNLDVRCPLLG